MDIIPWWQNPEPSFEEFDDYMQRLILSPRLKSFIREKKDKLSSMAIARRQNPEPSFKIFRRKKQNKILWNWMSRSYSKAFIKTRELSNYDYFFSFRGKDVRGNFISKLYDELQRSGKKIFMDEKELKRGENLSLTFMNAIKSSEVHLVVFSENYASSPWCLDELLHIMECQRKYSNYVVLPIFYGVDPSDVRRLRGSYGAFLTKHEARYPEKVQKWKEALAYVANQSGLIVRANHGNHAELVQEKKKKIPELLSSEVSKLFCFYEMLLREENFVKTFMSGIVFLLFRICKPLRREEKLENLFETFMNMNFNRFVLIDRENYGSDAELVKELEGKRDSGISLEDFYFNDPMISSLISYLFYEEPQREEILSPTLLNAIKNSIVYLLFLWENYASSPWCLDELLHIMECLRNNSGCVVFPIFYGVDPSDVRRQRGSYGASFTKHEARYPEKVQKWKEALTEVANLSGLVSANYGSHVELVQEITKDLHYEISRSALSGRDLTIELPAKKKSFHVWQLVNSGPNLYEG